MTGNYVLDFLLEMDDNTSLSQLLEYIKYHKRKLLVGLNSSVPNIDFDNKYLVVRIIKMCTLLAYKLDKKELPDWVFDERLYLEKPLFVGRHIDDFRHAKMFLLAPNEFYLRNVYFDLDGLERV